MFWSFNKVELRQSSLVYEVLVQPPHVEVKNVLPFYLSYHIDLMQTTLKGTSTCGTIYLGLFYFLVAYTGDSFVTHSCIEVQKGRNVCHFSSGKPSENHYWNTRWSIGTSTK